ncbi:nuclear transport factor 2 family protein [Chloroflexota bacterium]
MTLEELEARIKLLEDTEAISKMTSKFAYFIDAQNWQAAADLFIEDAEFDTGLGIYQGKNDITRFLREVLPSSFSFTVHMIHNPVIEVEGVNASGEWYLEVPVTQVPSNRALWAAAKYEATYIKIDREWKFKTLASRIYYITPFDEGWAQTKMAS